VHDLHGVGRLADVSGTFGRLCDSSTVDVHLYGMIAHLAFKESVFHVGDDGSGSDNKTFDRNDLVDICYRLDLLASFSVETLTYQKG
jgi:hypothetical protein